MLRLLLQVLGVWRPDPRPGAAKGGRGRPPASAWPPGRPSLTGRAPDRPLPVKAYWPSRRGR